MVEAVTTAFGLCGWRSLPCCGFGSFLTSGVGVVVGVVAIVLP